MACGRCSFTRQPTLTFALVRSISSLQHGRQAASPAIAGLLRKLEKALPAAVLHRKRAPAADKSEKDRIDGAQLMLLPAGYRSSHRFNWKVDSPV